MLPRDIASSLLLVSLLAAAVGCQGDVDSKLALAGLSSACRINSDCNAELVCVFERCHEQCSSSRDCERDARCVTGKGNRNVCQLADEAACSEAGSCPGVQVCGADAACRDACSSDAECLAEQICTGGTCADAAEVNDVGELTPAPGRPSLAAEPCAFDSDCPGSLACVAGTCAAECQADGDCRVGQTCRAGRCLEPEAPSAGCLRSSDCDVGELCFQGQCQDAPTVPEPECAYDSDCGTAGQHCMQGTCLCECATDSDCGSERLCDGACQCIPSRVLVGNVNVSNARQLEALKDVVEVTGELTFNIYGFGEYHLPHLRKAGYIGAYDYEATVFFDALEEVLAMNCYQDCRLPSLKRAGSLTINTQAMREAVLPALESIGTFNVWYSSQLQSISAPSLVSAEMVRFEGNSELSRVDLPQLESLDSLILNTNDRLAKLSLPNANPREAISIGTHPVLVSIELPAVTQLASTLAIGGSPLLQTIDLSSLRQVSGVSFYQMPKLSQLHLTSLQQVGGTLQFSYTACPEVLELPALTQLAQLTLFYVTGVASVQAPLLTEMVQVDAFNSPQLTQIALPIDTLTGRLYLQDNPKLQSVSFPNLEQMGILHVAGSPELAVLQLPALTKAEGVFIGSTGISNLDSLNPDISGSLATAGDLNVTLNPALPACAVDALAAALTAKGWAGSVYQTSNLECSCEGAVCL
jgi:hypothetical protein